MFRRSRLLPTINQLVRKGRKPKRGRSKSPAMLYTFNALKGRRARRKGWHRKNAGFAPRSRRPPPRSPIRPCAKSRACVFLTESRLRPTSLVRGTACRSTLLSSCAVGASKICPVCAITLFVELSTLRALRDASSGAQSMGRGRGSDRCPDGIVRQGERSNLTSGTIASTSRCASTASCREAKRAWLVESCTTRSI
jgi:hypothetical protein